jgi:glutathione peroxidase-family protein
VNVLDRLIGLVAPTNDERTLGDFSVRDIDGKKVDLKEYLGDVVLITNVASR